MFDGPDGVGKTTQVRLAKEALSVQGHSTYTTRVHGGTPIGEALRQVSFLDLPRPAGTDLHISLAMYYSLAEELDRHRQAGDICLVDRSPLSIIGYQVFGSGLDAKLGARGAKEALTLVKPDLMICYEAAIELLFERRDERLKQDTTHQTDFFESQSDDYMRRVATGYAEASHTYGALTIGATGTISSIHNATMAHIAKLLR